MNYPPFLVNSEKNHYLISMSSMQAFAIPLVPKIKEQFPFLL